MMLEDVLLWFIYVGALEARKLRKFDHITTKNPWRMKLVCVREYLDDRGMRL